MMWLRTSCTLACVLAILLSAGRTQDLLIADFEGNDYGAWRTTGAAFGDRPAEGTLPNQMEVTGFQGSGLANSFYGSDRTTGTLVSPTFIIQRDYITFLIGGGGFDGATCMQLNVDGNAVRTAVGPNTQPGGSENLEPAVWDVRDLKGSKATIEIIDAHQGGWGHITVDHIVQTDAKPNLPVYARHAREFIVEQRYLIVPIHNGAKACQVVVTVDGEEVRHYETELATAPEQVDWWAYFTLDKYAGKQATVSADLATEPGFSLIRQAASVPTSVPRYTERLRPQLRFSQRVGWNNDPNGMVYHDGEWHLFFQHNPVGWNWGNMTWGHAISTDLVHWQQQPDKLFPVTMAQGACFSGSGVVDKQNTAGFKTGDEDTLVVFLTDTGAGESLAFSNDRGRTFTWYAGNPVVRHKGRDPKVIWYEYATGDTPLDDTAKQLGGHWVMAVYDEEAGQDIAFYTSVNLRDWRRQSIIEGFFECPEIFQLPVDGAAERKVWVLLAADGQYRLGQFDGRRFAPNHEGKHRVFYGNYYAAQSFNNAPHGRQIQIGWTRGIEFPGMPFNQTFSFPHELTLHSTPDGIRLFAQFVSELETLRTATQSVADQALSESDSTRAVVEVKHPLLHVRAVFQIGSARRVGLAFGEERVVYDASSRKLDEAQLSSDDGQVTIDVIVDRSVLEITGNKGRVHITKGRSPSAISQVRAFAEGGEARLQEMDVHELSSIWRGND